MAELILGAGTTGDKRIATNGSTEWRDPVTLDINPAAEPDVLFDLNEMGWKPLPFKDDRFDEIHAYEILEHVGQQGDYGKFFRQFNEMYRILKPGGALCITVPKPESVWAWGDPGHTRVIPVESFVFLDREEYNRQLGVTAMSDYRDLWHGDFVRVWEGEIGASNAVAMQAVKPARDYT